MEKYRLGEMEKTFADLLWDHSPLKTQEVIRMGKETFGWKRTTTYTMLKRLIDRGLFENKEGTVSQKIPREDFLAGQGKAFLDEAYAGSLPQFLTTFTRKHRLSPKDIEKIRKLLAEAEKS